DHNETFGLYLAVLKRSEPSPLLPESDEDTGVTFAPGRGDPSAPGQGGGRGGRGGRGGAPDTAGDTTSTADAPQTTTPQADRAPRGPVSVQIDFDGLAQRIIAIPGVATREYSRLKAGVAGTIFYLQSAADDEGGGGGRGGAGGGSTIVRYRLSDRRAATFVTGAADFTVSADGRKLLYRTGGGGGGRAGGRGAAGGGT